MWEFCAGNAQFPECLGQIVWNSFEIVLSTKWCSDDARRIARTTADICLSYYIDYCGTLYKARVNYTATKINFVEP